MLCAVLLPAVAWLGYLVIGASPAKTAPPSVASDPPNGTSKTGEAANSAVAKTAAADKEQKVVLESKGYIIAAHQNPGQPQSERSLHPVEHRGRDASQKRGHPRRDRRHRLPHRLRTLRRRVRVGQTKAARARAGQPARGNRPVEGPTAGGRGQSDPARGRLETHAATAEQQRGDGRRLRLGPEQILGDDAAGRAIAVCL